ncbi:beta-lactamase family protein [Actinomycetaceae bacterium TAE3-ERU4]|nr:beta-lactamase family protein [Actinomycetaceae bacterium TAE3-ERU4]
MPTPKQISKVLQPYLDTGKLPGYTAVISQNGHSLTVSGGFSDLELKSSTSEKTIYRIASLTKPLGAVLALQAVNDGIFTLQTPVIEYLPELKNQRVLKDISTTYNYRLTSNGRLWHDALTVPREREITVRNLLQMTSGIGYKSDTTTAAAYTTAGIKSDCQDTLTEQRFLELISDLPLSFQPGDAWAYNWSIDVLGVLLKRATGKTLPALIESQIKTLLGLGTLRYTIDKPEFTSNLYREDNGRIQLMDTRNGRYLREPTYLPLRTGLLTTATDYTKILDDLTHPESKLLPHGYRDLVSDSLMPHPLASYPRRGETFAYCVSVAQEDSIFPLGTFGWSGSTGVKAYAHPDSRTTAVLFTNLDDGNTSMPRPWFQDFFRLAFNS